MSYTIVHLSVFVVTVTVAVSAVIVLLWVAVSLLVLVIVLLWVAVSLLVFVIVLIWVAVSLLVLVIVLIWVAVSLLLFAVTAIVRWTLRGGASGGYSDGHVRLAHVLERRLDMLWSVLVGAGVKGSDFNPS